MSKWGGINRPDVVSVAETDKERGGYICTTETLTQFYDKHSECCFSITRLLFKVVLIPDKNLFIILAGSLASLPINIFTSNRSTIDGCLFAAQLLSSLLFYISFLRFVLIVNRVREKGANLDANDCMTSFIPQAKRNVEFAACWEEYKKIKLRFFLSLLFFAVTIGLVFAGG